ncbi:hypothetical protein IMSHALPRED_009222 [Imshaugia aleurites]|uniref:N-acetyltransferase domain-containing protein n=1 Tax=Imshaugia aleurites TaxID=172621 RepID=A0A8H3I0S2_9LECA|nr:hypothetical protein IMSHALPRED_009222 [Imshaugia aleurites]
MEDAKEAKEAKVEKKQPVQDKASWRELSVNNIKSLAGVADKIHPDLPESDEVFAERVKLFPEGCLGLLEGKGYELCGYVISHPIRRLQPPALNSLLGKIASDADQYYIHDLAILPQLRGCGLAQECINKLFAIARRYPTTCLISVYGTEHFWSRFGFVPVQIDDVLKKKLLDYGEDATYLERKNKEYERQATTDAGPV